MSITVRQVRSPVYNGAYAGTISDSFTTQPDVGDYVIALAASFNGAGGNTVTDNQGNSYTKISGRTADTGTAIFYSKVATSSGTFTVTNSSGGERGTALQLYLLSGVKATSPADGNSVAGDPVVSVTTTAAGDFVVTMSAKNNGGTTYTTPSGFTNGGQVNGANLDFASAYKIGGAATTETATWNDTFAFIAAFLAEPASGPTVTDVSDDSADEGSAIVHTVTLSGATSGTTNYASTLAGSGTYPAVNGVNFSTDLADATYSNGVTFSAGNLVVPTAVSSFTVTIDTIDDGLYNHDLTYTLTVGGTAGTGTIVNTTAAPSLSINDPAAVAPGSPVTFTITQSALSALDTTVLASTEDDTAIAGVNYTARTNVTVTIAAGDLTADFVVNTLP